MNHGSKWTHFSRAQVGRDWHSCEGYRCAGNSSCRLPAAGTGKQEATFRCRWDETGSLICRGILHPGSPHTSWMAQGRAGSLSAQVAHCELVTKLLEDTSSRTHCTLRHTAGSQHHRMFLYHDNVTMQENRQK